METNFDTPISCPVLIGRAAELTALHLAIDRAKNGEGQIVLLSGEAGIGKSRLVAEVKIYATTQGFRLLHGNCFPGDMSCPYAPLLDLLRSHFASQSRTEVVTELQPFARELAQLIPDLVSPLPDSPPMPPLTPLEPEQEKRRLFEALTRWFIGLATKQPVLLIIEDMHWSDDTSLDFLHYLARRCAASPVLVLLTYRSDEVYPGLRHFLAQMDREHLVQERALTPLTRSDVSAMLHAIFALRRSVFMVPRFIKSELLDFMYTLTEGNPFFIEELLKSMLVAGEIFYEDGTWNRRPLSEGHILRSLHDAVHQRTNQLSEAARQVLRLAAIAGRRFDFALLQQLTQHNEQQLFTLMKELIAAQLIVEESEERFAFRHALTREAIYAELLARERKMLHGIIAETLERLYTPAYDAHVAELSYHFYESGTWAKALEYALHAGQKAQDLYSPRAAIEHFTRALDATQHLGSHASPQVYHSRGQAYESLGEFEHARHDYEQALDAARASQDAVAEWQSLIDLGSLWAGRDYTQTSAYFLRALEYAHKMGQLPMIARSLNRVGNWHLNVEEPLEALQCHQQALAIFQQLSDPQGIAETLDLMGVTSLLSGDLLQSALYNHQAIAIFRDLGNRQRLMSSLVTLMLCAGHYQNDTVVPAAEDFTQSLQYGELALKIAGEIGQRSDEAYTLIHMALCLGQRGEYARALEVAQRGLAIAEEIEHHQWMTAGHRTLGVLYLDLLELSEAQRHLEQAFASAQQIGSRFWTRIVSGFLALVFVAQHDMTRAETLLKAALGPDDPAQTVGQRLVWYARAELALARNDSPLALHITDQLLASAANVSEVRVIPRLWRLRGEAFIALRQNEEAEKMLRAAQDAAQAQSLRPLLWRIAIDLGKLYRVERRVDEAALGFATAHELIAGLAASIPEMPLRDHFLRQATALISRQEPLSPRRVAKKAFGGLTEREREVVALVAQGKSNREIAEVLVVNYRTIEKHIENVLSKLGFASRAQIAVWAAEKGLGEKEKR